MLRAQETDIQKSDRNSLIVINLVESRRVRHAPEYESGHVRLWELQVSRQLF